MAMNTNPKYTLAFDKRGDAYYAKKDYTRAIGDYTEAIRLSPDYAAAYNSRGTAYAMQGDHDRALSDYSKAISLEPSSVDFYLSRAAFAAVQGDNDLTIANLDEAVRLNPRRAEFYLMRGNAWIGKSDDERAQKDLDSAIALDPNNDASVAAVAWSLKGQIKYVKADFPAATQYYDEAVRLAPKWAPFYISRGVTWDARGEHNRAIRDYTQAITLQPDAKSAYFARGLAYFGQGDFVLAAEDFAELKRDASDAHGILWYHIARERAGSADSREEFARVAARQKSDAWPAPIFQLFQGQRGADSVQAAANDPQQRCEAQFYTGEWRLLQDAREAAAQALNAAATSCARISIEFQAAVAELRRSERQHENP
jgi:tetratricopeptide (TPR) repeat protein